MTQKITNYISFWGCLVISNIAFMHNQYVNGITFLVLAVIALMFYFYSK